MTENRPDAEPSFLKIDRYWFLTWTTYGSWLPGDGRGFTDSEHNQPSTPVATPNAGLRKFAEQQMTGRPVVLSIKHADILLAQFQETVRFRDWLLIAVAIMQTHLHLVVGVTGDPEPSLVLGDLKSYGSQALNRDIGRSPSGTWWTDLGSKRKLPDARSVESAVAYVTTQENPLLIWTRERGIVFRCD
jgi:REP element-mobilizing transposase RayT